jgi:hypothetical protein
VSHQDNKHLRAVISKLSDDYLYKEIFVNSLAWLILLVI